VSESVSPCAVLDDRDGARELEQAITGDILKASVSLLGFESVKCLDLLRLAV
jgi:hypothetical protein